MAAPLTEAAIEKIRGLILDGGLRPGQRLPAEAELSAQLGVSRSGIREAVRALVTAGVLDVRRGDGTYVTRLTPDLLLAGIGMAVELVQEDSILEFVECRRIIEPQVTGLAAVRADDVQRREIAHHLALMRASSPQEELVRHDADFHAAVARASGNVALSSVLTGLSSLTVRARVWRGLLDASAGQKTIAEHTAIYAAIDARDARLAEAAALVHVASVESWLRSVLTSESS